MRNKRKSLLLFLALLIIMMLLKLQSANGQALQYQIEQVCIDGRCKSIKGYIVIYGKNISIKCDTLTTHLEFKKSFPYKSTTYYKLEHEYYTGTFQISPTNATAFLDLHLYGYDWVAEMYYLKK